MLENRNKINSSFILYKILYFILFLIGCLPIYRTIYPKEEKVKIYQNQIKNSVEEVFLENDQLVIDINLRGALLENFYFKKEDYSLFEKDKEKNNTSNFFETVWLAKDNKITLPGRNTLWSVKNKEKNKENKTEITLYTEIKGVKFIKNISIEEYEVKIEDIIQNIPGEVLKEKDLLSYGGFSCDKQGEDLKDLEFVSYFKNSKKVLRVDNKSLQKNSKQKISNHDGILGVEKKFFMALCEAETKEGNIFLQNNPQNNQVNQMFFLMPGHTNYKTYKLYILPKSPKILEKYQFGNILNFGTFFFPITYSYFKILDFLLDKTSPILALLIMVLMVLFLNIFLTYFSEKEKYKIKKNEKEKLFIESNYRGKELNQEMSKFYQKHNINMLKTVFSSVGSVFLWVCLNWAVDISFPLRQKTFLWLKDLSLPDSYSIFNLYGLFEFSPSVVPFYNFIASDVLSIFSTIFMVYQSSVLLANNNTSLGSSENQQVLPNKLMNFIHYIVFLSMFKRFSSGFAICFILISMGNFLSLMFLKSLMEKEKI